MAIYHFQMKTVSRSQGRSATAAAAYRSGEKIQDERTGQTFDYSRRSGVLMAEILLPDGGSAERGQLWNAVEQAEKRVNSTLAREFVVALPHELSGEQQKALIKGYAQGLSERTGWAVDVAIHAPGKEGDLRNVHAHLLCTTRNVSRDPSGLPVMEQKTREWDQRSSGSELIRSERQEWERCVNQSLEQAQVQSRVDCRSHAEKQTGLEPQVHLGPTAMNMERKGIQTERGNEHRRIEAHNENVLQFQAAQSARIDEAFEQDLWKHKLGQMRQMPLEQLQKEREKYKPQSVDALIERDPSVNGASEHFSDTKAEHARLEKALGDHNYSLRVQAVETERYREAHPWKARLHDLRVHSDKELTERAASVQELTEWKAALEKQLGASQRVNMQAFQALDSARGHAMLPAMEAHEKQVERFREIEAIYQPQKEQHISQEQARQRQREMERQQQRELEQQKERERGGGRGWSR